MDDTALMPPVTGIDPGAETDEDRRRRAANIVALPPPVKPVTPATPAAPNTMPPIGLPSAALAPPPPTPRPPAMPSVPSAQVYHSADYGRQNQPKPSPVSMPPVQVGPETQRYNELSQQGRPELHGWKKALDVVGSLFKGGQAIEQAIPGSPQNYDARLTQQAMKAAREQNLGKSEQESQTAAAQAQFNTPEKRRAFVQANPDLFEGADEFQVNDFVAQGKFPTREPTTPAQKPENIQQEYADAVADAQKRGIDPAKDPKVQQLQDAITALQKQTPPPKENKAVAGTIEGKPAWGVQTEQGWVDPQTNKPIPNFTPPLTYGQTAPLTRQVQALDTQTGQLVITSMEEVNANPGRYAPAGEGVKAMQRTALINDIRQSAETVRKNLSVLDKNVFDRAKLAAALADPNSTPGQFMQTIPRGSLTPEAQDFVADLYNLREQAMAMRSVLGAGQGSEDLRRAILQTLPGVGSPSSQFGAKQINNLLAVLSRLEKGIPGAGAATERARTATGQPENPPPPKKGDVVDGYTFNGGDPADKKNWSKP